MSDPLVSVVIPAYNYAEYVVEAVESALSQTYTHLEVVVVDDGSTDDTLERLAPYASSRIRLLHQENRGAAAALNRGIREAEGEWIAWLSADDAFLPTKVEEQVKYARDHADVRVIYTDWYSVDRWGRTQAEMHVQIFATWEQFLKTLFKYCFINGSTTLIHRRCFETHGVFAEDLPQAHDWDLWLRLARDYRFGHLQLPLVRYRWHGRNLSAQRDALLYNPEVMRRAARWYLGGLH